ncbi:MAG: insulinase family protein [Nanoarchaeota archaeon]
MISETMDIDTNRINIATLSNGITLVYLPTDSKRVRIVVGTPAGEWSDPKDKEGLGHFAEHVFSGKESGGVYRFAAKLLRMKLKGNAANSSELTWFHMRGPDSSSLEGALELLAKSLIEPPNEREIELHRGIIGSELVGYCGDHEKVRSWGLDLFHRVEENLLSANIRDLSAINLLDLEAWHRQHITGSRMFAAIYGAIDDNIVTIAEKHLGRIPNGQEKVQLEPSCPIIRTPVSRYLQFTSTPPVFDAAISYIFQTERRDPKMEATLRVLGSAMGGSEAGLLVKHLRGQEGISYDAAGGFERCSRMGDSIDLNCYCVEPNARTAVKGIERVVRTIKERQLGPEELRLAKEEATGELEDFLEEDDGLGIMLGEHVLWGRALPHELYAAIDGVTAEEVYAAANAQLNGNHATIIVGSEAAKERLSEFSVD